MIPQHEAQRGTCNENPGLDIDVTVVRIEKIGGIVKLYQGHGLLIGFKITYLLSSQLPEFVRPTLIE